MLPSTEQNELHALLRQQGKLTQDGCWGAIEVFEKFLLAQPEQIEQEPIYIVGEGWQCDEMPEEGLKLYTSPKREPLSDDEIYNLMPKNQWQSFIELARSIEKAHGIGE